jgi:hypothetical protein
MTATTKSVGCSVIHIAAAAAVYRYLVTGGWLTNHYRIDDPNIINLALAIFEPVAILCVAAYWIWRTPFLARLSWRLCLAQILIGTGFLVFIAIFFLTWHPKMM